MAEEQAIPADQSVSGEVWSPMAMAMRRPDLRQVHAIWPRQNGKALAMEAAGVVMGLMYLGRVYGLSSGPTGMW